MIRILIAGAINACNCSEPTSKMLRISSVWDRQQNFKNRLKNASIFRLFYEILRGSEQLQMHKKCRVSHCAVILCIFYVQNMESYEVIKHTANICFAMAQIFYHKKLSLSAVD